MPSVQPDHRVRHPQTQVRLRSSVQTALSATRWEIILVTLNSTDERVSSMRELRDLCEAANITPTPFPYEPIFIYFEQYAIILREAITNIVLALVAVFFVTLVLIPHPVAAGLVFLSVALTLTCVLGFMHFWGVTIDSVSVINLVLAVGLSVDCASLSSR